MAQIENNNDFFYIYNKKCYKYPKGMTKAFMKACEGSIPDFNKLVENYGYFELCNGKHKYHSIQWAAEAHYSCRKDEKICWVEMRNIIMNKAKDDNGIREMLLKDENSEHYFIEDDYNILKKKIEEETS